MPIANGTHGEVRFQGQKVAKVTNVSIDVQRQVLESTGIGDTDDEYVYGRRSTSGSATLLYKTDDQATRNLMLRIFDDGDQVDELEIFLYKASNKYVSGPVLMRSMGVSASVGSSTTVNIGFVISGSSSNSL